MSNKELPDKEKASNLCRVLTFCPSIFLFTHHPGIMVSYDKPSTATGGNSCPRGTHPNGVPTPYKTSKK